MRTAIVIGSVPAVGGGSKQFVQESAPDRQELKIELIERIDRYLPDNVIIASSSSTFLPSVLAGR